MPNNSLKPGVVLDSGVNSNKKLNYFIKGN